jgi:hypothetical protein
VVWPLKEVGNPIVDLLEPKLYTALQSMFDPFVPHGWHYYLEVGRAAAAHRRRDRHARRTRLGANLAEVVLHRLPARRRPRPASERTRPRLASATPPTT